MSEYINKPIKITDIEDHEDGSATLQLELDPETYAAIFNVGFVYLIRKGIDNDTDIRRGEYDND
jgi:hypothetical protein|tara:strand:+ start:65 stop:256 length:192 start_codon:yes stop_codon:yes gene_type:complete